MMTDRMLSCAEFSPCRIYRYALYRHWRLQGRTVTFVGLNPSTADEVDNDPTIRRCIAFAKAWGFDGLTMANIFAFRATDPKDLLAATEPVGAENDQWLLRLARETSLIVCAWGDQAGNLGVQRAERVRCLLRGFPLHYLTLNKSGQPTHPLYIRARVQPTPFPNLEAK